MSPVIHPVVLCGGSGTRLWPTSRKSYPKQFVALSGERSLYQNTLQRMSAECFAAPVIVTGEDFRFMAVDQAKEIGLMDAYVIVEPVSRDTAPAVLAAALTLADRPDDLMLVAPSDHIISDSSAFHDAVKAAAEFARDGALVTFGVIPDRPETGYGYLKLEDQSVGSVNVQRFVEKPNQEKAEAMLAEGGYLWNAGLFLGRVNDFIAAFEESAPFLMKPVGLSLANAEKDLDFHRLQGAAFNQARAISLDYAIMEKIQNLKAIPLNCGWSDLGAWDAFWAASIHDESGNSVTGDVTAFDCTDSLLRSEEPHVTLIGLGLKDTIAVAMRDAVLVADKSRAQEVKAVVEMLRTEGKPQADNYPRFHRPWGWYETLCLDHRFQVKRIMVKPGGVLSLQSHCHRAEHWVVVAGTAEVTKGNTVQLVTENQSIYIPLGEKHRMANPGKLPMYLIEVQTGAYLGEDDIIRYEDIYQRV